AVANPARADPRRSHQKFVLARQEIRNLFGSCTGRCRYRPERPAPAAGRQWAFLFWVLRSAARGAGCRTRGCYTVWRYQRCRRPRCRGTRLHDDEASDTELSSAGQHDDYFDKSGRPSEIPLIYRAYSPNRARFTARLDRALMIALA